MKKNDSGFICVNCGKTVEKLGVTSKSVSRWENGRTMPDVSLFKQICEELDVTINELLSGEKTENNNLDITTDNMISYTKYLKRKENKKIMMLILTIIILLFSIFVVFVLGFNKTFLKTNYELDFIENASVPIPRFTYYRGTGGMEEYTTKLKTLKQPDEVNILIDSYLGRLDKVSCNGESYYYNKIQDFTIMQYRINNDGIGFINTIYIQYHDGNICE